MTHRQGGLNPPPPINIGQVDPSFTHEHALHKAAVHGKKKDLKKAIIALGNEKIDCKNDLGQTALFAAAYNGKVECMTILLESGAHPNERCSRGQTPMHASCYHGTVLGLSKLIEHGGDLRLHDDDGHKPHDFAFFNTDRRKRKDLLEYIEKARLFAMTNSGRDILMEHQSDTYLARTTGSAGSVAKLFKTRNDSQDTLGRDSKMGFESIYNFVRGTGSAHSLGFGTVYVGKQAGAVSTIPLIPDTGLVHDEYGLTFNNGAFMVMESMIWDKTHVTVKRLHHKPTAGGVIDLLIEESDFVSHLRHPNILLLMGLCQTHNLDSIVLLYERVRYGSLFFFLHERFEHLSVTATDSIMTQIADALVYTHSRGIVHCSLTSHAVQLVGPNLAKLSNFEYAVNYRDAEEENRRQWTALKSNTNANAVCNWMAPELLTGTGFPCEESDMYSYCTVLWEMLKGEIPWSGLDANHVVEQLITNQESLSVEGCPEILQEILEYGLSISPQDRKINFEEMRDLLHSMPKKITQLGGSNNHNNSSISNIGDLFYVINSPAQPFTCRTMRLRSELKLSRSDKKNQGFAGHSNDSSFDDLGNVGEDGMSRSSFAHASLRSQAGSDVTGQAMRDRASACTSCRDDEVFASYSQALRESSGCAKSPLETSVVRSVGRTQSRLSGHDSLLHTTSCGAGDEGNTSVSLVTVDRPIITKYKKANMISPPKAARPSFTRSPLLNTDDSFEDLDYVDGRSAEESEKRRKLFNKVASPLSSADPNLKFSSVADDGQQSSSANIRPPIAPRRSLSRTTKCESNQSSPTANTRYAGTDVGGVSSVTTQNRDGGSGMSESKAVSVQTSYHNVSIGTQVYEELPTTDDKTHVSSQTSSTTLFNRKHTEQPCTVYTTLAGMKTTPRTKKPSWPNGPYKSPEEEVNSSITGRTVQGRRRSICGTGSFDVDYYKPASHRTSIEGGLIVRPHSAAGMVKAGNEEIGDKTKSDPVNKSEIQGLPSDDVKPGSWSPTKHGLAKSDIRVSSLVTRFQSHVLEHKMKQAVLHGQREMVETVHRVGLSTPNLTSRGQDTSEARSDSTRTTASGDTVIKKAASIKLSSLTSGLSEGDNNGGTGSLSTSQSKCVVGKECEVTDVTTVQDSVCERENHHDSETQWDAPATQGKLNTGAPALQDPYYSPSEGSTIKNANSDAASEGVFIEDTKPKQLACCSEDESDAVENPEEFFIDDELNTDWDKRTRLQMTMTPGGLQPIQLRGSPRRTHPKYGITRRLPRREFHSPLRVTDQDFTDCDIINKSFREQFLEEYGQESSCRRGGAKVKHLTSTPVTDCDTKGFTKVVDADQDCGQTNTGQMNPHESGRYIVTPSKTNLETGDIHTHSKDTVFSPTAHTKLVLMEGCDNFV